MNARASGWRWVVIVALCGACNGTLRFDDHSTGQDAAPSLDHSEGDLHREAATCTNAGCRFNSDDDDCPGPECKMWCPEGIRCVGTCGDSCDIDCEQRSLCSLEAGQNAAIRCEYDAACQFTVAAGALIECWSRSECEIHCAGSCVVECTGTATCHLGCDGAVPTVITGRAKCP